MEEMRDERGEKVGGDGYSVIVRVDRCWVRAA